MIEFKRVHHQFSLFSFNDMKPTTKIPLKRISKERFEEAKKQLREGDNRSMLDVLRDINDALDRYEGRVR